ncbi:MAG: hypothetical protein LBO09_09525 [Candidatus Peribacteria bacterium]|jgi:hypothetical protein|nr:hypothetical protein [Candidatus Peribacteria bacterium]
MLEYSQQQNIQENDNVLLIGDRYQKMGKENINQYRETVLDIQSALSNVF